jgi:hypothetical protein
MSIDDIVVKSRQSAVVISGDVVGNGDALKKMFNRHPGECIISLKVNDTEIVPSTIDEETGEILDVKVSVSEDFLREVKELGLMATVS